MSIEGLNVVFLTNISKAKKKFFWVTVITTDLQLVEGHIRDRSCLIFWKKKQGKLMSLFHRVPYKKN